METLLAKIGLDDREITLYLICLRNEANTPASLVRQTGMKRTTVYFYLDRLRQKGFVTETVKGRRRIIMAVQPNVALAHVQSALKEKVTQQTEVIQNLIPQLTKLVRERTETTQVHFYEGSVGMRTVADTLLQENKDNYWIGSVDNFTDIISHEEIYRRFTLRRMQQQTTGYAITDRRVLKNKRASETLGNFRKFRILDKPFTVPAGCMICGEYTLIGVKHGQELKLILIKDSLVSELIRSVFKMLWDLLPERDNQ